METVFKDWVAEHSVQNANLAIARGTEIIGTVGGGSTATNIPVGVASLSKAITAVCLVKLVESGKLQFDARLDAILGADLVNHPPKDSRAPGITVAQLLTHTSGIVYDPSQGSTFNQFAPFNMDSSVQQLRVALSEDLGSSPGTAYVYNNMNYDALQVIIETVAAEPYDTFCGREVLDAVGATNATLDWEWASRGAYGGWKISPEAYVTFLEYFDPARKLIAIPRTQWPEVALAGDTGYSIGVNTRTNGDYSHFGDMHWSDPYYDYGAYFMVWHEGVRFVVTYSPDIDHALIDELEPKLHAAAFP